MRDRLLNWGKLLGFMFLCSGPAIVWGERTVGNQSAHWTEYHRIGRQCIQSYCVCEVHTDCCETGWQCEQTVMTDPRPCMEQESHGHDQFEATNEGDR